MGHEAGWHSHHSLFPLWHNGIHLRPPLATASICFPLFSVHSLPLPASLRTLSARSAGCVPPRSLPLPWQDFYSFVCGNWEAVHPIPADRGGYRYGTRLIRVLAPLCGVLFSTTRCVIPHVPEVHDPNNAFDPLLSTSFTPSLTPLALPLRSPLPLRPLAHPSGFAPSLTPPAPPPRSLLPLRPSLTPPIPHPRSLFAHPARSRPLPPAPARSHPPPPAPAPHPSLPLRPPLTRSNSQPIHHRGRGHRHLP